MMSVTIANVTQRVADRYTYETVETNRLKRTIAAAVTWYNRYAPRTRIGEITTVADQENYARPSDCPLGGVETVYWFPGIDFVGYVDLQEVWADVLEYDPAHPSEQIMDAMNRGYLRRAQLGAWDMREGEIVLIPTPTTAGRIVYFQYEGQHELNGGGTAYETIPDEHLEVITILAIAELLEDQGLGNLPKPDYSDGLVQMRRRHIPKAIREEAKYLRRVAAAELSRSPAVVIS